MIYVLLTTKMFFLNKPITMEEVQYAIQKLSSGQTAGIVRICNEILKQPLILKPVCAFLKTCFNRGVAPTLWVKSIINPILKDLSKLQGDKPPLQNIESIFEYFICQNK